MKTYLCWKFCYRFLVIFQYIASTLTSNPVSYSDFTVNSYDYFLCKAGYFKPNYQLLNSGSLQDVTQWVNKVQDHHFFYGFSQSHMFILCMYFRNKDKIASNSNSIFIEIARCSFSGSQIVATSLGILSKIKAGLWILVMAFICVQVISNNSQQASARAVSG